MLSAPKRTQTLLTQKPHVANPICASRQPPSPTSLCTMPAKLPLGKTLREFGVVTVIPNYTLYPNGTMANMVPPLFAGSWLHRFERSFSVEGLTPSQKSPSNAQTPVTVPTSIPVM